MRKISKSKKAFTLVELMLAIAIMMIVTPCIVMLILTITKANQAVYRQNDIVDYAYANRLAFETKLMNAQTIGSGDQIISVSNGVLTLNGSPLIPVDDYFAEPSGVQTWDVLPFYSIYTPGVVEYRFLYYSHSTGDFIYEDAGTIYIPHMNPANCAGVDSVQSLQFSNY